MVALKDSITKENLLRAFAGECQAWRRYEFAATQAKTQNLEVLYWLFHYTGNQEKEHAEVFYNHLKEFHGQEISLSANYPIDNSNNIQELLQLAAQHEAAEHDTIYKSFGDKAKEEGFANIANSFYMIAEIEKVHSQRFSRYAQLMQNNKLFKNDTPTEYICLQCGHIHKAAGAPQICPVCSHNQGFFVRREDSPFGK
ncbi:MULTISPECIES: rubrerythrin family protein [Pelosinus]|jgi:rubrerythrin|uniref:Rubrerythrin n=1 Tax=Pelosinus fermentans B4 TaxID=1149862 RepID=I9ARV3_9FIRM|nr:MULTISPECIES: ferritin family protein [Pelosinus]EIW15677.1 Rubrerythrin [Pelosinus fermentans B4]EIW26633.1 Rubrerythrin [Pelosinus fermentans A11]OAM92422.1 Rubrerythrin [Pelosinus fermentans DSM 17108]SDQ44336.1 Rubrerythrin [Pelosinus fermentans]